jgi:hypothetical protein
MFGIHRCGLCVGGQTGRLETEGLDSCAVCGGDDSCVGCDNVVGSNKMSDACGACLALDDQSRDSKFLKWSGNKLHLHLHLRLHACAFCKSRSVKRQQNVEHVKIT